MQLFAALLLGMGLGLCYGFLRPLRKRCVTLGDGLFVLALFWAFLYLAFGICQADLRPGCLAALGLGGILWESTAGRLLQRPFSAFWNVIFHLLTFPWRMLKIILKKFVDFAKNYLHLAKNRVQ